VNKVKEIQEKYTYLALGYFNTIDQLTVARIIRIIRIIILQVQNQR